MRRPPPIVTNECQACRGYGYFTPEGEPTIDRSWLGRGGRKCLDCRGTGTHVSKGADACSCGGEVMFVTDSEGRRIFFLCPKCKQEWEAPIREIASASMVSAWDRGLQALAAGVVQVRGDETCGLVQIETKDGCTVQLQIREVAAPAPIPEGYIGPFKTVGKAARAGRKAITKKAKKR